jgi:glutamyl/glutaminyl-tRNA synthetase
VRFVDGLRGDTGLGAGEIGDFVVARTDGTPTYNLAVVVDDHDMRIDRVVRGEDHLPNTPRQILLYEALGWQPPAFAHLPLVLGPDRSRLSKRHGATSVAELRAAGILPEGLCNFLALLGWNPPDGQEVLSMERLRAAYDLADVAAANSVFDRTKLEWLNGQHLAALAPDELLARAEPFLAGAGLPQPADERQRAWLADALTLVGIGKRSLAELAEPLRELLYPDWPRLAGKTAEVRADGDARAVAEAFRQASLDGRLATEEGYREAVNDVKAATGAKGRGLFHPLRLAISGQDAGPELKQLVPLLEVGAALELAPPVAGVAARIECALVAP